MDWVLYRTLMPSEPETVRGTGTVGRSLPPAFSVAAKDDMSSNLLSVLLVSWSHGSAQGVKAMDRRTRIESCYSTLSDGAICPL
jgi:hypothetical protein